VKRAVVTVVLAVSLGGCLVPSDPAKQAEEISSISAEGALLAQDAAEGETTETFTRVHAEALRGKLALLEPSVQVDELRRLLAAAERALVQLGDSPEDRVSAVRIERRLDETANAARELAG
jgi:hypothetical protein